MLLHIYKPAQACLHLCYSNLTKTQSGFIPVLDLDTNPNKHSDHVNGILDHDLTSTLHWFVPLECVYLVEQLA